MLLRSIHGVFMRLVLFLIANLISFNIHALLPPGHVEFDDLESKTAGGLSRYVIRVTGNIAFPMADEIDQIFSAKIPMVRSHVILHLNSGGGALDEGLKIISLLEERKKIHNVVTTVRNGEMCGSMCVPIFMVGVKRFAAVTAAFMFHGVTKFHSNVPDQERTRHWLSNVMVPQGVSEEWLQGLWAKGVFSTPGEYWMTGKELLDEKSGVITDIMDRHVKLEPVELPFDPQIRSR